jgi:serine/threonine-protein kinase
VLHQIGVGALGPVFRTYEPTRDRLVAVKVFRLDITPEQAQALAEELARAAEAGLFHPSIVEPLAAGVEGTVAYRAEEYVAAESLDVAMRHYAPATLQTVLPFITQLAGALDFARAAGVGHGALHPRDVFVTPEEARATGFGVVDALERVGLRAPVRRPYSAPERIAGAAWGSPADVFSLGAIAFELLTGRRPAGTGGQIGVLPAGADAERLHSVLARAMHDDPAARYPTALAFAAALEGGTETGDAIASVAPLSAPVAGVGPGAPAVVPFRPPAPPPPVSHLEPQPEPDLDDIAAERDEDAAHWELSLDESRAAEAEADEPPMLFEDSAIEAAADELFLDAAELTLAPEAVEQDRTDPGPMDVATEAEDARPAPAIRRGLTRPEARVHDYDLPLTAEVERERRGDADASRTPMFRTAMVLIVGLLLGFAAAYAVLTRGDSPDPAAPTTTQGAAQPPAPAGTTASAPAPKEFSEQAVTPAPPPAKSPAPGAAPPDVPPDAPLPGTAGGGRSSPPAGRSPAASAPRTGSITVRSTPAGASVTLNGTWRGRTPITLDELAFGNYVVRIVAPGYEVAREDVRLSAAQAARTISERLQRQPAPARGSATPARGSTPAVGTATFRGSVYVDSRPRGAKVFVNGKELGTTPLRIPELPIGAHVVRLELKDHHTWTSAVRITSGEEQRVTGSLEPIR